MEDEKGYKLKRKEEVNEKKHSFKNYFIIPVIFIGIMHLFAFGQMSQPLREINLLQLLGIIPSPESIDYVVNKTQFQLHTLLTEQRHPKTWNLSEVLQKNTEDGLRLLLSVDDDIVNRLQELLKNIQPLEEMVMEIEKAILAGKKIYFYGCGATGRLAKQMESGFWRPFWKSLKEKTKIWSKLEPYWGDTVEDQLIGEMTGGDRALISSLEGFEDLQLIGRLQLQDRGISREDIVICVTEGGETSSVIGTILAALEQWKADPGYDPQNSRKCLYFVYNNPDERLLPFERSRKVLEEPGITKINLTTGPQAITGSTRMQATTIETFVLGNVLQTSLERALRKHLSKKEMAQLGWKEEMTLSAKLQTFASVLQEIRKNIPAIARFTEWEAETYAHERYSTYFAQRGLITVFIDSTERSPTFRLFPLDTVREAQRKCWIQVWTPALNLEDAWQTFLGRSFRGLADDLYRRPFEEGISDPYLKTAALESLKKAGSDQQFLYDFSFSEHNLKKRSPEKGDLGVFVAFPSEIMELETKDSPFRKFIDLFHLSGARLVGLLFQEEPSRGVLKVVKKISQEIGDEKIRLISLIIAQKNDPFGLNQQIACKILLNAHSTAVMTKLGRVIGNTMTNVSPSNLKLIGRATYLIQSHVNSTLQSPQWVKLYGYQKPVSYGEANAVLFEAINFLKGKQQAGQTAEVALSIIWILQSLLEKRGLTPEEALNIVQKTGLRQYLASFTSEPK